MLFASISDIANKDKQNAVWLNPNGQPWDNWGEFYESFFDCMTNDPIEGARHFFNLGYISESETKIIYELAKLLDEYKPPEGYNFDDRKILKDKNWNAVCETALTAIRTLTKTLSDQDELTALKLGDLNYGQKSGMEQTK